MCGRFTRSSNFTEHANQVTFLGDLGLRQPISIPPSYNVAPTQNVAAVRSNESDGREVAMLRRGLVPGWAPELAIGAKMINARSESVAEKPAYRSAFKNRRCLILTDGFYEWGNTGKAKQPYFIHLKGGKPFCFAGLWERWSKGEQPVETCTIIRTGPNKLMEAIHDRMPVIVAPEDYGLWLDGAVQEQERLTPLLRPFPDAEMEAYSVSTLANSPRNNSPECVRPI